MLCKTPRQRFGGRPTSRLGAVAVGVVTLSAVTALHSAAPKANQPIGNQATAAYMDATGVVRLATSNTVLTTVQQVGSFALDDTSSNSRWAGQGTTVYMPHVVTNTGNGLDSFKITVAQNEALAVGGKFSKIEIFADADGDGRPDGSTPLCTSVSGSTACATTGFTTQDLDSGGMFRFVVAYSLEGANQAVWDPAGVVGTVTAKATNTGLYAPGLDEKTSTDVIKLTNNAAFAAQVALQAPAVVAPSGLSWPAVLTSGKRSAGGSCGDTFATMTASASCTYSVYTITYTNNGATKGDFYFEDQLPAGLTYVKGSAIWNGGAAGVALGDGAGGDQTGVDYEVIGGNKIQALVKDVVPTQSGTLSFVVLVNNTAAVGDGTTNNFIKYSANSCSATTAVGGASCGTSTSNVAAFQVLPTYSVSAASISGANPDSAALPPTSDTVTQPSAVVGGIVKFATLVKNHGNATDIFRLSVNNAATPLPAGATAFPAGTTFSFFRADGATPLLDTDGDGAPDSGPMDPNSELSIVVQAHLPSSATVANGVNHTALVTAASRGDISGVASDGVWVSLTNVLGALVDLTNTVSGTGVGSAADGDLGPGPSPQPTVKKSTVVATNPGDQRSFHMPVAFDLYVRNSDSLPLTFNLRHSQNPVFPGSLPVGWTVTYVPGGNACGAVAPITEVAVPAGQYSHVVACVAPPVNAVVGTQDIFFQAVSKTQASSGIIVSDAVHNAVDVTAIPLRQLTLSNSNSGQIVPGGTLVFAHTLSNTGNQTCGAFNVNATLSPADVAAGWIASVYLDVNADGKIDAGDTRISASDSVTALTPGQSQKLLVQVFAPGGAVVGANNVVTVTVTDTQAVPCGSVSAVNTSNVITGTVRVYKYQAKNPNCTTAVAIDETHTATLSAKAGDCLTYMVVAVNEGEAPVTNVSLGDSIPAYTNYEDAVSAQPAVTCESNSNLTGTPVTFTTQGSPVTSVSCGSVGNTLLPNGSLTLRFAVRINP